MPFLDDAITSIHDLILSRFGAAGGTPAGTAVAFEFGTPISIAAIAEPNDPGKPSPARAAELMAGMSNAVPDLQGMFFGRGLRSVDGQYEILLKGSQSADAGQLDLFAAIKREALDKFDDLVQSVEGLHQFHPVGAEPANWFDPSVGENWTHFHVATERRPDPGPAPAPTPPNIRPDPRLLQFRSVTPEMKSTLAATDVQSTLRAVALAAQPSQPSSRLTTSATFQQDAIEASNSIPVLLQFFAFEVFASRMTVEMLKRLLPGATIPIQWLMANTAVDTLSSFVAASPPAIVVVMNGRIGPPIFPATDDIVKSTLDDIARRFVPTVTDKLVVDFDMCIVTLTRPWLSDAFLTMRNWLVPGVRAGEFSDGPATPDGGDFNAIPIACVLVRNLTVRAQWTSADLASLETASHLGPFSLEGHSFDQGAGTLTMTGIQSIAWVCTKAPLLPPLGAAALSPA